MVGPDYSLYEGLNLGWGIDPDYFVHKGGMIQLTRFAASKLGPRGVRVNVINPGGLLTNQDPQFVARYNARTFLRRMANNTDLKGVIVFLASDASCYITGANIPVDGGYTAK
jgi:NAD(P)-dependent dehydrogenase (short-subunit alcohol dehydrogenase family)